MLKNKKWRLVAIYFIFVAARFFLALIQTHIFLYTDELLLLEFSRSLLSSSSLEIRGLPYDFSAFLYPLVISPAHILGNSYLGFICIKLLNSLIMNLAIFPVYALANRMAPEKALQTAVISLILPELCFVSVILAENLLYPVVMCFFYLVYRYFTEESDLKNLSFISILSIIMFFIKPSSLYFPLGFFIYAVFLKLMRRGVWLNIFLVSFFAALLILFLRFGNIVFETTFLPDLTYLYGDRFLAVFRYFFLFFIYISVAFGFYFLIMPIIYFKEQSAPLKEFLSALYFMLVIAVMMVILIISMNEDYPRLNLTPHLRYLFYFVVPFMMVFQILKTESSSLKGGYITLCAAVLFQVGMIRFSEGNFTAFMSIAFLRESLLSHLFSMNLLFFRVKAGAFDLVKIGILIYTLYISALFFKGKVMLAKRVIFTTFIVIALINNIFCYKASGLTIDKNAPSLIRQTSSLNDFLGSSSILFISRYAAGDKVFESYTRQNYYYTTAELYRGASFDPSGDGITVPLVSMQWAVKKDLAKEGIPDWHKLDTAKSVSNPIVKKIEVEYLVTGQGVVLEDSDFYKEIKLPDLSDYHVYMLKK